MPESVEWLPQKTSGCLQYVKLRTAIGAGQFGLAPIAAYGLAGLVTGTAGQWTEVVANADAHRIEGIAANVEVQ